MPTIAYAMSDMAPSADGRVPAGAVTVAGGCGECHEIGTDAQGRPHIACDTCAPILTGSVYGWASTPHGVPLTPDELASRELAKRDVEASQAILVNAAVQNMLTQQAALPAAAPALSKQDVLASATAEELLAAMPPETRAALEAAVAAQTLAGKDPAPVRAARTTRSSTTRR